MPGTFTAFYVLAFSLDGRNQLVATSEPQGVADEGTAVAQARRLAAQHEGAVAFKREGDPVVGEEGEPEIVFQSGRIGDFF
ncbi:hypothetical protein ACQKKX_02235 [Neorhizobium sp. NPDC001467]|uniref:hypothetical protein n=1 Tax=Neorhizobium sp. NPDC001467 TaxID=3390595 RepID=UPI003D023993